MDSSNSCTHTQHLDRGRVQKKKKTQFHTFLFYNNWKQFAFFSSSLNFGCESIEFFFFFNGHLSSRWNFPNVLSNHFCSFSLKSKKISKGLKLRKRLLIFLGSKLKPLKYFLFILIMAIPFERQTISFFFFFFKISCFNVSHTSCD